MTQQHGNKYSMKYKVFFEISMRRVFIVHDVQFILKFNLKDFSLYS